jgi:hypothetical protein
MLRRLILRESNALLVMDASRLQQLDIPPNSSVELCTDGQSWIIRPIRSPS